MKPLIKWPGGKSGEINKFIDLIPDYGRYIEPFFGGGALYFRLCPDIAAINDISSQLMNFYLMVKKQDCNFKDYLIRIDSFLNFLSEFTESISKYLTSIYFNLKESGNENQLHEELKDCVDSLTQTWSLDNFEPILLDKNRFAETLRQSLFQKFMRTLHNDMRCSFDESDILANLKTGFFNAFYVHLRTIYNQQIINESIYSDLEFNSAVFFFIREFCYGSMFRFNNKGEFNVPYGGISYNQKRMQGKISRMFNDEVLNLFSNTTLSNLDFQEFLDSCNLTKDDFIFLDPPYDTAFSEYDKKSFTKNDHKRLAEYLKRTPANFILVIQKTEYILSLYDSQCFKVSSFDNRYTYNIRGRNSRLNQHLIISKSEAN